MTHNLYPLMNDHFIKNTPSGEPLATLLLAHGAGAPMDSDFMNRISELLCERGCEVIRFEFPYMAERRTSGNKRPPNNTEKLLESWRENLQVQRAILPTARRLVIGGKSMGGRMASLVAEDAAVDGLICLGYPFHPAGKPETLRTGHLLNLTTPTLIIQGTRDPLGNDAEVKNYSLSPAITVRWLPDGDHDFKPRVKSGYCQSQHWIAAADYAVDFIQLLTTTSAT